jgi:hypothetical protein
MGVHHTYLRRFLVLSDAVDALWCPRAHHFLTIPLGTVVVLFSFSPPSFGTIGCSCSALCRALSFPYSSGSLSVRDAAMEDMGSVL